MVFKILGTGCANCVRLEKNVKEALVQLQKQVTVEKVTDIKAIMAYGILSTPALVLDEKVLFYGHVPSISQLVNFLKPLV